MSARCPDRSPKILRLPLKGEFFDAIKSGEKKWEYRLRNAYWTKRLSPGKFDEIVLTKGYPNAIFDFTYPSPKSSFPYPSTWDSNAYQNRQPKGRYGR